MKILKTFTKKIGKRRQSYAIAQCPKCNSMITRQTSNLKKSQSCGCWQPKGDEHPAYKHGKQPNGLYQTWKGMRDRCQNDTNKSFDRYGGRGISVASKWQSFDTFRAWAMANGWKPGLEINRVNNDGNYSPSNCDFVTRAGNCQNRCTSKLTLTQVNEIRALLSSVKISELAKRFGVSWPMIKKIKTGKSWKA